VQASKEAFDKQEAANAEQRARRLISEREFIQTRETLALESIGREEHARLEAIDREIAAQQRLLAATTEPEKRTAVQGQLTALTDQRNAIIAGAREQSARVQAQATQDTADLARRLADTITESTAKTLEAQGHLVEAASTRINRQFDDLIREAEKAGNAVGAAVLRAERDIELERANVEQLTTGIGRATTASENQIARVNSLLAIHAITTRQAQEEIVRALSSERDAIAQSIPLLEAQAKKLPVAIPRRWPRSTRSRPKSRSSTPRSRKRATRYSNSRRRPATRRGTPSRAFSRD
jgi:hypothetical protein